MNKILRSLVFIIFAAILPVSAQIVSPPGPVSGTQKEAIEKIVRDYLLKNPVVIREAIEALQEQEEKERSRRTADNIKNLNSEIYSDPGSPVLGNGKGDVSIVVFYDYFCGYCKKTLPGLQSLLARDSSIRIVYKELPIMGPQSYTAAKAALAANRQGKFAGFHQALLEANGAGEDVIKEISDRLGLDYAALRRDMNDPEIVEAVDRNIRLAGSLDIAGTPAYLIGGRIIPGAVDSDHLWVAIKAARARALADREKNKTTDGPGK